MYIVHFSCWGKKQGAAEKQENARLCIAESRKLHCKKVSGFPVPSQDVTLTKLSLAGNNLNRESLVSDILAGDGKTANLFLTVLAFRFVSRLCIDP